MASSFYSCVVLLLLLVTACGSPAAGRAAVDDLLLARFEQWMAEHGRAYTDADEKQRRFQTFKDNLDYIEHRNRAGLGYTLGLNQFSDLTHEEFLATYTGAKLPPPAPEAAQPFAYANVTDLPDSVDWRSKGVVTGVKMQAQCGSCWAFSATGAIEAINQIRKGELISLSEQQLVDCDHPDNSGCNGGFMERAFDYVINNGGIAAEENYTYTSSQAACNDTKKSTSAVTITGYEFVPRNDEAALMQAVANQPVSVYVSADKDFYQYSSGVLKGNCSTGTHHAVLVVGYGQESDGTKYWILKNSWGGGYGEGGYIRIQKDVSNPVGMCGIAWSPVYPTI